jgi:phage shock protein A
MEWTIGYTIGLIGLLLTIGGILISVGGLIYSLRTMIQEQRELKKEVEALSEKINTHTADKDAHVNHLYMRMLKESIDKMDTRISEGFQAVGAKFDKITDKIDKLQAGSHQKE